jgi:hypothetical protein
MECPFYHALIAIWWFRSNSKSFPKYSFPGVKQKKFPGFECNASVFWLIVLKRIGFS